MKFLIVFWLIHNLVAGGKPVFVTGKITWVSFSLAKINVGEKNGVKKGDKGEIFYVVHGKGGKKKVKVCAKFEVVQVKHTDSLIKIKSSECRVEIGYGVRIVKYVSEKNVKISPELRITSVPDRASVYINGKYSGVTPVVLKDFSSKSCEILIKKPDYLPVLLKKRFENEKDYDVHVELVEAGYIKINTEPKSASIYIDDKKYDYGNLMPVATGSHKIKVSHPDFLKEERNIFVKKGQYYNIEIKLKKKPEIIILSQPTSVFVTYEGRALCTTPCRVKFSRTGKVKFSFNKKNYFTVEKTVHIKPNLNKLFVKLAPVKQIIFKTDPEGAEVYINYKFYGYTPVSVTLKTPDNLYIKIEKIGYLPIEFKINPYELKKNEFFFTLEESPDLKNKILLKSRREKMLFKGGIFTAIGSVMIVGGGVLFYEAFVNKGQAQEYYKDYSKLKKGSLNDFDKAYKRVEDSVEKSQIYWWSGTGISVTGLLFLGYGVYNLLAMPDAEKISIEGGRVIFSWSF